MTHIPGGFAVDINHEVTQLDNAADDYRSTVYYLSGLEQYEHKTGIDQSMRAV